MDAAARKASLDQSFVESHCGLKFLPDRLPVHRRGCAACKKAAKAAAARKRSDGLEECRYCGRTFFPDRLAVHERCCANNKLGAHGIRPTMTPGETKATVG